MNIERVDNEIRRLRELETLLRAKIARLMLEREAYENGDFSDPVVLRASADGNDSVGGVRFDCRAA